MSDDTRFDQDDEESDLLIPIARSETFDTFWNSPRRSNSSSVEIVETELSQKFLKTMAEIYNDLDSPGQSMSLLHASLTSLSELLIFVKKVGLKMERSETWSIESQDPRLQYIRALVHGDTLMRLAGFSWKKSLQAWVLLLSRNIDLAPYIVLVQRHQSKTEIQIFDELAPPRINYSSFSKTCELNKLETKVVGSFLGGIFGDLLGIPFDGWKTEIMEKWFVCVREIYALPPSSALPEEKWHDLSFQRTLGVYSTEVSSMLALTRMILNKDCPSNYTALREDLTYELGHERPRGYLSSMKAKFPFDSLHIKSKEHILANTLPSSMCSDHEDLIGVALLVPLAFKKTGIDLFRAIAQFLLPTFHMNVVITAYIHCLSISYLHKCVDANPLENLKTFLAGRLDSIPHEFSDASNEARRSIFSEAENVHPIFQVYRIVIQLFLRSSCDPLSVLLEAVNGAQPYRSHVAMWLGALLGAFYGYSWIPSKWLRCLSNRKMDSMEGVARDEIINLALALANS